MMHARRSSREIAAVATVFLFVTPMSAAAEEQINAPTVSEDEDRTALNVNFVSVFEAWRARVRSEGFATVEEGLLSKAVQNNDVQASADVAYFYFAMGLFPEAAARIRNIDAEARGTDLLLLESIVAINMGRWREAAALLSRPALKNLPDAGSWRGIAFAELGAFNDAAGELLRTPQSTVPFEENATNYYLARAQAAIEIGHIEPARASLESVRNRLETTRQRDARRLFEARAQLAHGETAAAVNALNGLQRDGEAPVSLLAQLALIRHHLHIGALSKADALDHLEQISVRWGGGAVDRERLELEAALHEQSGNVIASVAAQRKLLVRFPHSDAASAAEGKIRTALSTILNDRTLSPRIAAKTFYENINLAPPGAKGDALIRDAVDILAGLDLLSEAAELLRHQVFERLRGAERSRVAGDLAELYLAAGDPSAAIEAIENTRRTRLPEAVAARRNFLEADAYFRNGKADHALGIIDALEDFDALILKGRILTAQGNLPEAGAAYEAAALVGDGEITAEQADAAILAAAAYTQAGDRTALNALSEKLDARLAPGPAKDLFSAMVADDLPREPNDFQERYAAYFDS